jgi:ribosomal protein S18 acetylase RimI-like enzyme
VTNTAKLLEKAMTLEIRSVSEAELPAATRLTFTSLPADDRAARDFIARAPHDLGLDFRRQFVALADGRLVAACLYVLTAGHGAVILPPALANPPPPDPLTVLTPLLAAVAQACRAAGARLIQSLLDADPASPAARPFLDAGFAYLATLDYLELDVARAPREPIDPAWHYESFTPALAPDFIEVIRLSYQDTKDCPALDRTRTAADALEAHQASGLFTPDHWTLARRDSRPAGLVLVNRMLGRAACELVYMGVIPEFRGLHLGDALVRQAVEHARAAGQPLLTLAVDAANLPARRLYDRAGFRPVARRWAFIAPLNPSPLGEGGPEEEKAG